MTYTILELAKLAGISSRTLRYYDQIGLLVPKRDKNAQYRKYDSQDASTLQYILLCKEMGMSLFEIKRLIETMDQNEKIKLLSQHIKSLEQRKKQINQLIQNVHHTIQAMKGDIIMSDTSKFEGLKEKLIQENEDTHKEEVVSKWGEDAYQSSKKQFKNLSKHQFEAMNSKHESLIETLKMIQKDPTSETLKKKAAELHKDWLSIAWGFYDKDIHLNLVSMYLEDERFKRHYDQHGEGLAQILKEAVHTYV